ncbi:hypothetical protein SCLCIDRAFT_174555 [Scleroderma citrinum Foug A]|uniref:Uncharacterized protein n=1 Tax=Scleroderma citrinum Foug A TaxID=1036808 RepID=A0A0C3AAS5_9AGAM|nr:hypothetical protein SCLCIDRAFT_174555 [Scleroderma citrinum Foug A]
MNNLLSLQTMAGKAAESTQEVAEYYASPTSVSPAPRASSEDIMIEPIIATPSSNSLSTYGSSNPISISHCTRGDPAPLGSTCALAWTGLYPPHPFFLSLSPTRRPAYPMGVVLFVLI